MGADIAANFKNSAVQRLGSLRPAVDCVRADQQQQLQQGVVQLRLHFRPSPVHLKGKDFDPLEPFVQLFKMAW